jgi:hypothetical protein
VDTRLSRNGHGEKKDEQQDFHGVYCIGSCALGMNPSIGKVVVRRASQNISHYICG